jgi:hypothetical protein
LGKLGAIRVDKYQFSSDIVKSQLPPSLKVPVLPVRLVGEGSLKKDIFLEWKINVLTYGWGFLMLVKTNQCYQVAFRENLG